MFSERASESGFYLQAHAEFVRESVDYTKDKITMLTSLRAGALFTAALFFGYYFYLKHKYCM